MMEIRKPINEKTAKQSIRGFFKKKILPPEARSKTKTSIWERKQLYISLFYLKKQSVPSIKNKLTKCKILVLSIFSVL